MFLSETFASTMLCCGEKWHPDKNNRVGHNSVEQCFPVCIGRAEHTSLHIPLRTTIPITAFDFSFLEHTQAVRMTTAMLLLVAVLAQQIAQTPATPVMNEISSSNSLLPRSDFCDNAPGTVAGT